jgi:hypothetical protein
LQDFVWQEMDAWGCSPLRPRTLVIRYTGCVVGIEAPLDDETYNYLVHHQPVARSSR